MTIQTLFNRMMLYDNQLDLIASGDDVARGLIALNLVQDWFEAAAGGEADILQTASTFTTTASQEYTTWPSTLIRLDAPYLLDSSNRQIRLITPITQTGGHRPILPWPLEQVSGVVGFGSPWEYYAVGPGGLIYWAPTPDAVYTIRAYGLWAASDYTAAADTFAYPDSVALVLVPHATQVIRSGLDRDLTATQAAADAAFKRVIKTLGKAVHQEAASRVYADTHET